MESKLTTTQQPKGFVQKDLDDLHLTKEEIEQYKTIVLELRASVAKLEEAQQALNKVAEKQSPTIDELKETIESTKKIAQNILKENSNVTEAQVKAMMESFKTIDKMLKDNLDTLVKLKDSTEKKTLEQVLNDTARENSKKKTDEIKKSEQPVKDGKVIDKNQANPPKPPVVKAPTKMSPNLNDSLWDKLKNNPQVVGTVNASMDLGSSALSAFAPQLGILFNQLKDPLKQIGNSLKPFGTMLGSGVKKLFNTAKSQLNAIDMAVVNKKLEKLDADIKKDKSASDKKKELGKKADKEDAKTKKEREEERKKREKYRKELLEKLDKLKESKADADSKKLGGEGGISGFLGGLKGGIGNTLKSAWGLTKTVGTIGAGLAGVGYAGYQGYNAYKNIKEGNYLEGTKAGLKTGVTGLGGAIGGLLGGTKGAAWGSAAGAAISEGADKVGGWLGDKIGGWLFDKSDEERMADARKKVAEMNAKKNGTTVEEEEKKLNDILNKQKNKEQPTKDAKEPDYRLDSELSDEEYAQKQKEEIEASKGKPDYSLDIGENETKLKAKDEITPIRSASQATANLDDAKLQMSMAPEATSSVELKRNSDNLQKVTEELAKFNETNTTNMTTISKTVTNNQQRQQVCPVPTDLGLIGLSTGAL